MEPTPETRMDAPAPSLEDVIAEAQRKLAARREAEAAAKAALRETPKPKAPAPDAPVPSAEKPASPFARTGAANGRAKLSPADVEAIRASTEPQKVLAERYGVSQSLISNIRAGRRWAPPNAAELAAERAKAREEREARKAEAATAREARMEAAADLKAVMAKAREEHAARMAKAAAERAARKANAKASAPPTGRRERLLALSAGLAARRPKPAPEPQTVAPAKPSVPKPEPVAPAKPSDPEPQTVAPSKPSDPKSQSGPATREQLACAFVMHMLMRSGHLPLDPALRFHGLTVDYEAAAEDVAHLAWRFEHDLTKADFDAALALHGIKAA